MERLEPQPEPRGDADGMAHLEYFDRASQLSFVINAATYPTVHICHGGSGEPVVDTFQVPITTAGFTIHELTIPLFERLCELWLAQEGEPNVQK